MAACEHEQLSPGNSDRVFEADLGAIIACPRPGFLSSDSSRWLRYCCGAHSWEHEISGRVCFEPRLALQMPVMQKNFFNASVTSAIAASSLTVAACCRFRNQL